MQALFEVLLSLFFLIFMGYISYIIANNSKNFVFKIYALLAAIMGFAPGMYLLIHGIIIWIESSYIPNTFSGIFLLLIELSMSAVLFGIFTIVIQRYDIDRQSLINSMYGIMVFRIVLILLPQNNWFKIEQSISLATVELIAFIAGVIITSMLVSQKSKIFQDHNFEYLHIALAIFTVIYSIFTFTRTSSISTILLFIGCGLLTLFLYRDFRFYKKS